MLKIQYKYNGVKLKEAAYKNYTPQIGSLVRFYNNHIYIVNEVEYDTQWEIITVRLKDV